jgi:copper transport protein
LTLSTDVLHLAAVSVWVGGLVMLSVALFGRADLRPGAGVMRVFSAVALTAVSVVVASGIVQSWRQLDGLHTLTSTSYGRLLLAKVIAVVAILGLAVLSRRRVHAPTAPRTMELLRLSVLGEVVVAVVVFGITASLVAAPPARIAEATAALHAVPFSKQLRYDGGAVVIEIEPARQGLNDIHLYVTDAANVATDVLDVTVELTPPIADAAALKPKLTKTGVGHYSTFGADLPLHGTWHLTIHILLTEINQESVETDLPVT